MIQSLFSDHFAYQRPIYIITVRASIRSLYYAYKDAIPPMDTNLTLPESMLTFKSLAIVCTKEETVMRLP